VAAGTTLHVEPMPSLGDRDRERLVKHFQQTADLDVDVPLNRLPTDPIRTITSNATVSRHIDQ